MAQLFNTLPADDLTPQLPELWQQEELCDVTLVSADKQRFRAHKIILASASRYFKALFVGAGKHLRENATRTTDSNDMVIELEAVDADSLGSVLTSIYQKNVEITPENVEGLLSASNYLDVAPIRQACCQVSRAHRFFVTPCCARLSVHHDGCTGNICSWHACVCAALEVAPAA